MKSILEELYDGKIFPEEQIVPKDHNYRPLNEKISELLEEWKKKLSEDDYYQLESFLELCSESSSMEASESFVYGFKLGALIMVEVFTGRGDLVRKVSD